MNDNPTINSLLMEIECMDHCFNRVSIEEVFSRISVSTVASKLSEQVHDGWSGGLAA